MEIYEDKLGQSGEPLVCNFLAYEERERERAVYLSCILPFMRVFICFMVPLPHGTIGWFVTCECDITLPRGYKTFFVLNSAENEIYPAHQC